jgi:two-component system, OmpR family, aerobic respiration control sensor histidine kinase ArcB
MPINIDEIDFYDFDNLFDIYEPKFIDLYINSFYSFLFLKNNSFYRSLKSIAEKNLSLVRIISVGSENQFDSIRSSFSSIGNISFNNLLSFSEQQENFITININKKALFFFKIIYDESKMKFNCNLYNIIFNESPSFFSIIYDFLWDTMEKNKTLEKHNVFQQDFIDIASHQLRNPILPIVGFSKTLRSKIQDSTMLEYLDIIIRNGEKLRDIANDILDVSRLETNSLRINKDFFDIDLLLSNIITEYQNISLGELVNIKFIYYGKSGLFIEGDKSLLSQALYNLLNNSYFFTKNNQGQEIIVSLLQNDDYFVTITIEDEGPGVQEKDLDQIFKKFFTKTSGGTGLGLFISKKLFELHGGSIDIKNRSPDLGLKIIVKIPICIHKLSSQSLENISNNNKILFIDDFSENFYLLKNKIQDLGYEIDYYDNPLNAMESFIPFKYSLVFLGIDVGGIDGFDLYDELKKRDNGIKGYFMTSNKINKDAIDEVFNKDILNDQFLYKPISLDSIINIIKKEFNN